MPKKINFSENEIQWIVDKFFPASNPDNLDKISEELGAPIKQSDIERQINKGDSQYTKDLAISVHSVWIQEQIKEMQMQQQQFMMREENYRQAENSQTSTPQDLQNFKNELNRDQQLLNENETLMKLLNKQNELVELEKQKLSQLSIKRHTLLKGYNEIRMNLVDNFRNHFIESNMISTQFALTTSKVEQLESEYIQLAHAQLKKGKSLDSDSFNNKFNEAIVRVISAGNPEAPPPNAEQMRRFNQHKTEICEAVSGKIKSAFDINKQIAACDKELDATKDKIDSVEKEIAALIRKFAQNNSQLDKRDKTKQTQQLQAGANINASRR